MVALMYHNPLAAAADGVPVAGGQVTLEGFRRQVKILGRRLIHPREAEAAWRAGRVPRGVLITFDDGGAGIVPAGRILAEAGTAGVAFICPGAFEQGLWLYTLADCLTRTQVGQVTFGNEVLPLATPQARRRAYSWISPRLFDLPPRTRDARLQEIVDAAAVDPGQPHPALRLASLPELREAAAGGGLVFANHTWSHPNLVPLDDAVLADEIDRAAAWLEGSGLPTLPWFAFPRGRYDRRVVGHAQARSRRCFGANPHEPLAGVIPRVGVYRPDELSGIRFRTKLAVLGRGFLARAASRTQAWMGRGYAGG